MEKLKMIRGSKKRAEELEETLINWGAVNGVHFPCTDEDCYYFVINGDDRCIYKTDPLLKYMNYEVVELSKPEQKLQPFQKVLVCNSIYENWKCNIFSHKEECDTECPFYCIFGAWTYCIPYEGNEHLVGTTDSPKGGAE